MSKLVANPDLVGSCGSYCPACRQFQHGDCAGCGAAEGGGRCQVQSCCAGHSFHTCAECDEHGNAWNCPMFQDVVTQRYGKAALPGREEAMRQLKWHGLLGFVADQVRRQQDTA